VCQNGLRVDTLLVVYVNVYLNTGRSSRENQYIRVVLIYDIDHHRAFPILAVQ